MNNFFVAPSQILAVGIDTLCLTSDYSNTPDFSNFEQLKVRARENREPTLIPSECTPTMIMSYGGKFHAYNIQTSSFILELSASKSKNIPSIKLRIKAQSLWLDGISESIEKAETFMVRFGILGPFTWKPSRVDIAHDCIMPDIIEKIPKYKKTHANTTSPTLINDKMEYVRFGAGEIQVKFYDKAKEISFSGKHWFYDIWQISPSEIPKDKIILRCEYQLRRKALKEFKVDTMEDLFFKLESIWSYLTKDWFKLLENPLEKNKPRQKITRYWQAVINAISTDNIESLKRDKSKQYQDLTAIAQGAIGMMISYIASKNQTTNISTNPEEYNFDIGYLQDHLHEIIGKTGWTRETMEIKFKEKLTRN